MNDNLHPIKKNISLALERVPIKSKRSFMSPRNEHFNTINSNISSKNGSKDSKNEAENGKEHVVSKFRFNRRTVSFSFNNSWEFNNLDTGDKQSYVDEIKDVINEKWKRDLSQIFKTNKIKPCKYKELIQNICFECEEEIQLYSSYVFHLCILFNIYIY